MRRSSAITTPIPSESMRDLIERDPIKSYPSRDLAPVSIPDEVARAVFYDTATAAECTSEMCCYGEHETPMLDLTSERRVFAS